MKKIIIALIAVILICVMALSVSAEWQNPFIDVKENHWYYDAVKTTVEKGIFTGMTENTFVPNGKMTRAMFVTTLAKMVDAEVGEYKGLPFTDVKAKHWYAPYVQWAYDNGISSGMSADRFGVNDPITREQMVTLFYNTAAKFGADTTVTDTYKFDKVYDDAKIRDYAVEAMKWAMQNSIISGTGVEGKEIIVDPWGTATRAQAAQIITMYLKFTEKDMPAVTDLTINGNPIESYTIVCGAENPHVEDAQNEANRLKEYISEATGFTLDITNDSQEPEGPEILIGITNRESMGLVTADRDGEGIESFEISVQGNFVLIAGKSDAEERYDGTLYGVYAFAEEILDVDFYSRDVKVYNTIRGKDIPDGYVFKDSPGYEFRTVYWKGVSDELSTGSPFKTTGIMHNMNKLVGYGDATSPEPCYSDENNLATIEKNFLNMLYPGLETIWVTQNDTTDICDCAKCKESYSKYGGRSATLMLLMNRLAKAAEDAGYPDVEIWTYAYSYSIKPVNFQLDDQVVIYFAPISGCAGHPYKQTDCKLNKVIANNLDGWDKITKKIYTWDYSTNFFYSFTPMPLTKVFRENKAWFYERGVRGEFNNGIADSIGEFDALKAYILAELQWDPTMSEETYRAKIADFLNAYYGPGGKYINEYITLTEQLCDKNCFGFNAPPSSVISNADVLANKDKIDALWDAAEAMCENETQYKRIRISRTSWTYMYLDALHTTIYAKGTDEQKAEYERLATEFYEEAISYDLAWAERTTTKVYFDPTKSPATWAKWD